MVFNQLDEHNVSLQGIVSKPNMILSGYECSYQASIEEVAKKTNKSRQSKGLSPVGFWIFILISGLLGLIASSLIFNLFSDSSQNETPKQELIKKTK